MDGRAAGPIGLVGTLALLAACGSGASHAGTDDVQVSVSACGRGWHATTAGDQTLRLHNTDSRAGEVEVLAPSTGAVYAYVEPLGPGTTVPLHVRLTGGKYALRCLMEDEPPVDGPTVSLHGTTSDPTPGVVPATQQDLLSATRAYQRYVRDALPGLRRQVTALAAALDRGSVPAARRAWLTAHATYERLGAAYDAFGDLDGAINGLAAGLPKGTADSSWTGFHRIEDGLWHGESDHRLAALARRLDRDVAALAKQFHDAQIDPLTLTIRAHEITENALQFTLTGKDDFGSHSAGVTLRANLAGTRTVLRLLHGVIVGHHLALARAMSSLATAQRVVRTLPAGVAISALPRAQRERLDAALSELTEQLAPFAAELEPRRDT